MHRWIGLLFLASACTASSAQESASDATAPVRAKAPADTSTDAAAPPPSSPDGAAPVSSDNPFAGAAFYVLPNSKPKAAADAWRGSRPADAAQLDKIAAQPWAAWFGDWVPNIAGAVDDHVTAATSAGALPVLVAYDIPHRDCGNYSAGGATNADTYRTWIEDFAKGIAGRRSVVILEPDALPLISCLSQADQDERYALLSGAVDTLTAGGKTAVYIDTGLWVAPADMAGRLQKAGVVKARGFSVNVSNFETNATAIAYGHDLSARVGNKAFVIDTSRNGLGPAADRQWCNPPGRALGQRATAETGDPLVDAFFWIKIVGESDGSCNGGPAAGTFWPEYALGLAQRAAF